MADDDQPMFPPAMFAKQFADLSEEAMEAQRAWFQGLTQLSNLGSDGFGPTPMQLGTATFKTRVQSNGRLSIPDAEREALDIEEGDIVQVVVIPVKRNRA